MDNLWAYIGVGALCFILGFFITDAIFEYTFKRDMREIHRQLRILEQEVEDRKDER